MAISKQQLETLVSASLDEFYRRRMQKLSTLKLDHTLKRKNPYLFRAVGVSDASEIVEQLLNAYMSSSDEGIFGDAFFEPLAKAVSGGATSPTQGVDVVIETDRAYKAIAVKSGPSVFNAQSRRRQDQDFQALRSRMLKLQKHFEAIVGYCYGQKLSEPTDTRIFKELAGQAFWAELTGDESFYLKIIDAMSIKPTEHKAQYIEEWTKAKNRFTLEFAQKYCAKDGGIDWAKLVKFNSGRRGADSISKKTAKITQTV